ncbi:hypothetical protein SAMN04488023_14710 [Pedobacter rhizosphaerae]|uniref:Uncharacterized protein n=1 Tax=Pedobacter rhizosphaerae TaxID=390241 RepID=A0A1H9VR81_9SPHI|nr:hypothetical protein SAMN04488023_14710 [Pedobacter rhizosphaerae]
MFTLEKIITRYQPTILPERADLLENSNDELNNGGETGKYSCVLG